MRSAALALVVTVIAAGCGGPAAVPSTPPVETEAPAIRLTVSVSDTECTLEPDQTNPIAAGPVVLITVNETDAPVAVDLWRITDDHAFEELAAHIDEERALAEAGEPGLGHPAFVTGLISSGLVDAGRSTEVDGRLRAGTHGIVCLRDFDAVTDVPFRPFTAIGPLEVE